MGCKAQLQSEVEKQSKKTKGHISTTEPEEKQQLCVG